MENVDLSELQKERLAFGRDVATSIGPTRTSHYLPDLEGTAEQLGSKS